MRKLISLLVTSIILALCMPIAAVSFTEGSKYLGLKVVPVPVVGTGSMYPSLFWEKSVGGPDDDTKVSIEEYRTTPHMYHRFSGISFAGRTYLRRSVGYGDMVAFKNTGTEAILAKENKDPQSGFIKRVIGLPGDTIELRDGYVYKNSVLLEEAYIYRPRSTYGDKSLQDCQKLRIPQGQLLVMGDNRKTSADSRGELGLIRDSDITYILPYKEQSIYQSLWRDTSRDSELSGTPTLDSSQFLKLVNAVRKEKKLTPMRSNKALIQSSVITGNKYLQGDKDYALKLSLAAANYSNIITSEFVTLGHYNADELLQNLLYFPDTAKQIMDSRYQDIGVAAVNQIVDGCPTQVIVGHLGGYIPAEYEENTIASWNKLQKNLESVIPSWESAREFNSIDQTKLETLLKILHRRLALASEIVDVMRNNKWLTDDEQQRIKADSTDADQADQLINDLNKEQ